MIYQPAVAKIANLPTPHGQERLATQPERDEVRRRMETRALHKQTEALRSQVREDLRIERQAGDHVNRFLLCTLVSESSRQIKASAEKAGASLLMTKIVRSVLRNYRLASIEDPGFLTGPSLDLSRVRQLNERILRDEIARQTGDTVTNSEARLARAVRLGDDARIKAEKDDLEYAVELRDRLAGKLR